MRSKHPPEPKADTPKHTRAQTHKHAHACTSAETGAPTKATGVKLKQVKNKLYVHHCTLTANNCYVMQIPSCKMKPKGACEYFHQVPEGKSV